MLAPQSWEANNIADQWHLQMAKAPIEIREKKVRAACKTSQGRRVTVKAYHAAKELMIELTPAFGFAFRIRYLDVWGATGLVRLGWWQRDEQCWRWSPARPCT